MTTASVLTLLLTTFYTADGGTHLTGFRTALTKQINSYARSNNLLKDADPQLSGEDVSGRADGRNFCEAP